MISSIGGKLMPPYMEMYLHLFNAITDALDAAAKGDCKAAAGILIAAQQWGEERYLEAGEEP